MDHLLTHEQEELLDRRRQVLADYLEEAPNTLGVLAADVKGRFPEFMPDLSLASLELVQAYVAEELEEAVEESRYYALQARFAYYLAECIHDRCGGRWSVVDNPEHPDFGRFVLTDFDRILEPEACLNPADMVRQAVMDEGPDIRRMVTEIWEIYPEADDEAGTRD